MVRESGSVVPIRKVIVEILVIVLWCVAVFLFIIAFAMLVSEEYDLAKWIAAACIGTCLAAWGCNTLLVVINTPPVYSGGVVTTISQQLEQGVTIYRVKLNGNTYVCEDDAIKCADIKLGAIVIGQKWANDGWTWRFRPTQFGVK